MPEVKAIKTLKIKALQKLDGMKIKAREAF